MLKSTILFCLTTLLHLAAMGQGRDFLHIEVQDYRVVDSLPLFTHEIKLASPTSIVTGVEVLYPEYATLTPKERQILKLMLAKGRKDGALYLEHHLNVNRKEAYLNVSFSPIVLHEGKWKRLSSCKLEVKILSKPAKAAATAPVEKHKRWKQQSVLSQGKWAKIRVDREGIYCITPALLQQMGFSHMERIKVFGYGGRLQPEHFDFSEQGQVPDDLVEVPTIAGQGGRLFWAEGTRSHKYNAHAKAWTHTNNHYSAYSYYFVTEGDGNTEVEEQKAETPATIVRTTVPHFAVLDEDKESWYEGGRRLFDGYNFAQGNAHSFTLALPDLALSEGKATVQTEVAFAASSATGPTTFVVKEGNEVKAQQTLPPYNVLLEIARAAQVSFKSVLREASVKYDFTTTAGHEARLDYIRVNYPRQLRVSEQAYSFSPQGNGKQTLRIANVNAHTQVWCLARGTRPTQRIPLTIEADGVGTFTTSRPEERFICFDSSRAYVAPEYVGEVATQNLHADENIDYVIVIPASGQLMEQAERLAQLHREREGMRVKVVRADWLYNEFSSGTPDANAYRRYLKMLYDRAVKPEKAPKYLLLMGKSPWDARLITKHWVGKNPADYLLPYEADYSPYSIGTVHSYLSDDFYALLDDNEGVELRLEKLDVAVGRMVATTAEEARRLVDKVEQYLDNKNTGAWKNKVVMLGDDGDANEHMEDADEVADVIEAANPRLNVRKIYWDSFQRQPGASGFTYPMATTQIHQQMASGAVMFNYCGHGAPHQISHEKVLGFEDFRKALSPNLALWVVASCEIYPFDAYEDNLAESSLYLPDGGSIAFMCATRAVYASQNAALNAAFSKYVVGRNAAGQRVSMGEALRLAKNDMLSGYLDTSINKLKYVLFGDPALKLSLPTGTVMLDSIDGQPLAPNTQLSAGRMVRFSGYVAQADDAQKVDRSFSGSLEAVLFDRLEDITCKDNDGSARESDKQPFAYKERTKQVFVGSNVIKEGRFDFTVVIPRDISYTDERARLSLYAVSQDKQRECNGVSTAFHLNGTDAGAIQDVTAPKIVAYLNSPDTPEMAIVDDSPTLIAHISDESGINVLNNSVGHQIELILDDNTADRISLNEYFTYDFGSYQQGTLSYPLKGLSVGTHRLSLRVWDVNDNVATTQLRFVVAEKAQKATSILATENPARQQTTFVFRWEAEEVAEGQVQIEVLNTSGQLLWTHSAKVPGGQNSYTLSWPLNSATGQRLAEGIYLYRATVHYPQTTRKTPTQKLIISRL